MLARPDRKANGGSAGGGTRRPSSPHGRYLICSARVRRRLADYGEQNDIDLCGYAYGWGCQICQRTVAYRPGSLSEVLTGHYRRVHPEALGVPSR